MSILFECDNCFLISHDKYIRDVYKSTYNSNEEVEAYILNQELFNIQKPYRKPKSDKMYLLDTENLLYYIRQKYNDFKKKIDTILSTKAEDINNSAALKTAEIVYGACSNQCQNSYGGNNFGYSTVQTINNNVYLFPKHCKFYNYDVLELQKHLGDERYNVIVLDPPWWNKYIRRKRKKSNDSYDMMFNSDLLKLPIPNILQDNGIVVVWCTNSQQNFTAVEDMFKAWNLKLVSQWFWLKVTIKGEPICDFSKPPGKQPFEKIVIGCNVKNSSLKQLENSDGRLLVSVPSSLHSHKPPLVELMKMFLPDNPNCLEVFARYLLPGWTSYGLEAIKFQHISAYTKL